MNDEIEKVFHEMESQGWVRDEDRLERNVNNVDLMIYLAHGKVRASIYAPLDVDIENIVKRVEQAGRMHAALKDKGYEADWHRVSDAFEIEYTIPYGTIENLQKILKDMAL